MIALGNVGIGPAATSITIIRDLRAHLVPHREWALRRWFYRTPLWYYHLPARTPAVNSNSRFYALVDPDLRELCMLLHDAGIRTTPSCQGHFYKRSRFERIWNRLVWEQRHIVRNGLKIRDSETDEVVLFRDPSYRLPWRRFGDFYGDVASHQRQGYLGVLVPLDSPAIRSRFMQDRYRSTASSIKLDRFLTNRLGAWTFAIEVHPTSLLNAAASGGTLRNTSRLFAAGLRRFPDCLASNESC